MSNWKEWCKLCNRCPYLTEECLKVPCTDAKKILKQEERDDKRTGIEK